MKPLSPRQRDALQFIIDFKARKGYPPSLKEIATGMGLASATSAFSHCMALQKKGYIYRPHDKHRVIDVWEMP